MSNTIRRAAITLIVGAACLVMAALSVAAATLPGKPPTATDDAGYTTSSDAPVVPLSVPAPGLLANDVSPSVPLASLSAIKVSDPSHGTVTVNADGSFTYTPTANYFGPDSFTYKITGGGVPDSNVATVSITVTHVNLPPVITKPGAQNVFQGDTITFSTASGKAITVTDPDAGTSPIVVTLGATQGTITVGTGAAGVNVTGNGTGAVTLTGPQAGINADMDGMTYTATGSGADSLTIGANDQGNTGSGGAKTASDAVAITVTINQPPVAGSDTYNGANSAVGNTTFSVGQTPTGPAVIVSGNVLSNDTDADGDTITLVGIVGCADTTAPFDNCATTQGGTVSLAADGTFTFLPKAGFVGDDTFQYTITDGRPGHNVNGTVTIHVANMVWYVNGANAGTADGRSSSPFTSTASVNAVSGTGDIVFIYSGSYTGGLALKDSQTALGQPAGLLVASHQLVAAGGTRPSIANSGGNDITLGSGNTIDQINLGDASGFALSGGAAGSLAITNMAVNNTTGGCVSITGGALTVTLDRLTCTGGTYGINLINDSGTFTVASAAGNAISGATTAGVNVDQNTVSLTFPGTVTSTASARSVAVTNKTGGTVAISGAIVDTGTGIALTGNNASTTINLNGGLTLNTIAAATALTATGGGTITATGTNSINAAGQALSLSGVTFSPTFTSVTSAGGANNVSVANVTGSLAIGGGTLSGATGTALSVTNTNIAAAGLTFKSISISGGTNGIVLNTTGTSGGLTVTGNHPSDPNNATRGNTTAGVGGTIAAGDGGTIQNTSGSGIILTSTKAVVLRSMKVLNAGGATVNSGNNGITATTVSGLTLDNMLVTGSTGNSGLRGTSVTDLAMQHTQISGNGTAVGTETNDNWNVRLDDLAGNCNDATNGCAWQNSLFFNARETVVGLNQGVTNTTVSTTFTITNSEFRDTTTSAPGSDAFLLTANRAAVTNLTVTGSTFKNAWVTGFHYIGNEDSSGTVNVRTSTFDGNGTDINLGHQFGAPTVNNKTLNFDITGNTTRQVLATGSTDSIAVVLGGNARPGSAMTGKITNNTIGNAAVTNSGSATGGGIQVSSAGSGTITATVTGNNVHEVGGGSAFFTVMTAASNMNLKIRNNDFETNNGVNALAGIELNSGTGSGSSGTMFLDIGTPASPGANTAVGNASVANAFNGIYIKALGTTHLNILGYTGADNDDTAVATYVGTGGGAGDTSTPAPSVFHSGTATIHGVTTTPVTFP